MVRLNKNQLSKDQFDLLFNQLNTTLGKLTENQTKQILIELLGNEERVMIAKRLAIVVLLLEDKSLYKISEALKVSPATAKKIKFGLDRGDFDQLVSVLGKNKNEYFSILEALDAILHLGGILPHYNGPDRYKHLR